MVKRTLSAIVMALIFIPLIIAGDKVWALAVSVLALFAFKEIINLLESHNKIPSAILLLSSIFLLVLVLSNYGVNSFSVVVPYKVLILLIMILLLPILINYSKYKYTSNDAFYLFGIILFLGIAFNSMIIIRNKNIFLFIYLLLISLGTDTFSYIFGSLFGKHKLAPNISKNKTIEGAILGSLSGSALAVTFYYFNIGDLELLSLVLSTYVLSIIGIIGDLIFSKIKRENNIKDYSNIIPGHGGILDRLDSTLFVFMFYVLLMNFF